MDIGPISAIRPVTMIKPSLKAPDLSRVFEAEYLGQSKDDEYSSDNRNPSRGLEDEEDTDAAEALANETSEGAAGSGKVNFYA
jgi:hypothetical protein